MITGSVAANLEAWIELEVRGPAGQSQIINAMIDSGFSGFITLPISAHSLLGTPRLYEGRVRLADGTVRRCDVHELTVIWDGQPRVVESDAVDNTPLVGTAMLKGHELHVVFEPSGPVTIQPLP